MEDVRKTDWIANLHTFVASVVFSDHDKVLKTGHKIPLHEISTLRKRTDSKHNFQKKYHNYFSSTLKERNATLKRQ